MGLRTLGRRLKSRDAMASTGSRSSSPQQGCCHVHYSMILPSAKRVTTTNFSATSTLCSYLTLNTISGIRIAFITESEGFTLSPRPHRQVPRPWRTTSSFEYHDGNRAALICWEQYIRPTSHASQPRLYDQESRSSPEKIPATTQRRV